MPATPKRILVVDDDDDIRSVLTRYFTGAGHEVQTASNGRDGLQQVRDWSPDIVFLDLEMPEMNGLDVLRYIHADHASVRVISFSGHAAAAHLGADAKRLGAIEFFAKPFDLERLGEVVAGLAEESDA